MAPPRKLPAIYLLDSIVKNVGTPYTIYFSRGLYSTFMDAYASVDNGTRRKMDEMLKTWKEPVPGSVDPRPVFSPETVRPIESALIKAKTSAFQAQQEHLRSEQQLLGRGRPHNSGMPYRETPTPPGGRPGYPPQGPYPQQTMPSASASASSQMAVSQQHQSYPIHPVGRAFSDHTCGDWARRVLTALRRYLGTCYDTGDITAAFDCADGWAFPASSNITDAFFGHRLGFQDKHRVA